MSSFDDELRELASTIRASRPGGFQLIQGWITAVNRLTGTATVLIPPSLTPVPGIAWINIGWRPSINRTVWLIDGGPGQRLILGEVGNVSVIEPWHIIGDTGEPAFAATWSNYGTVWRSARYYKDPDGWVHLSGLVKSSSSTDGTVIFVLPVGYRPASSSSAFMSMNNDTFGAIGINIDGSVRSYKGSAGNQAFVNLDNVSFFAGTGTNQSNTDILGEWMGKSIAPVLVNGFNQYDASVGNAAMFWQRDDGLVLSMGLIGNASAALTAGMIYLYTPEMFALQYTQLQAMFAYTGVYEIARADYSSGRGVVLSEAANGFQFYFDGIHVWTGVADSINPWTALPLVNGWVWYGIPYTPPQYKKDKYGIVHLRGMIKSGAVPTTIATLPAGYRPIDRIMFQTLSVSGRCRIDIENTGVLSVQNGTGTWITLDGLKFRPDQ